MQAEDGFFFSSRRRHTRLQGDWSSDVCSSDLSYTVVQRLWRRAGIRPDARWLRADTGPRPQAVLQLAAELQAYAVVGHIPLHFGKMGAPGIELLLHGDPLMRQIGRAHV